MRQFAEYWQQYLICALSVSKLEISDLQLEFEYNSFGLHKSNKNHIFVIKKNTNKGCLMSADGNYPITSYSANSQPLKTKIIGCNVQLPSLASVVKCLALM